MSCVYWSYLLDELDDENGVQFGEFIPINLEVTMKMTAEQNEIWQALYERQLQRVEKFACQEYLEGFAILDLPADRVPDLNYLNQKITPRTGWRTVRTQVRYTDAVPWYQHFARKEFLITDYMRDWAELDFTPEPDMFHDIFGHLPFMLLPGYTELQELFAPAFQAASPEQREDIKRLAWFSTEFGLIREHGDVKVLGAGLISSAGEMENVLAGNVPLLPFDVATILKFDKAVWSFNQQLFVIESLQGLKDELRRYFNLIR
jgi:phenylalanine-4-hydroxylase